MAPWWRGGDGDTMAEVVLTAVLIERVPLTAEAAGSVRWKRSAVAMGRGRPGTATALLLAAVVARW